MQYSHQNQRQVTKRKPLELSGGEKFWYYLVAILSFGWLYFVKVAAKKALVEASQNR